MCAWFLLPLRTVPHKSHNFTGISKPLALIALSASLYSPSDAVETPIPTHTLPKATPSRLPKDYVAAQAAKFGLTGLALCIVENESEFKPDQLGDGHLTCPLTGERQRSRGLWQISDCWHPEVPDDVAFSVSSSTEWSLTRIKSGYANEWSTYARCKKQQSLAE